MIKFEDYLEKVTEKIGYSEENLKLIDEKKNKMVFKAYKKCGKLPSIESIYQMLNLDEWIKGRILEDHVKIPLYVIPLYLIKNDEFNSEAYDIYKEYPFQLLEDYFWCYSVLGRSCPYLDLPR